MTERIQSDREIDIRKNDGLIVRMMLVAGTTDRVYVNVLDDKKGEYHKIPVPEGATAKDVFEHPFTYLESPQVEQMGVILGNE